MEEFEKNENIGVVKISDEVVSVIAGIAAQEIDGIIEGSTGIGGNITNLFKNKKNGVRTTKVTLAEDKAIIDMSVAVEYGKKIMDLVAMVQDNVKKTVEAMTGLQVEAVNITVQNIYLPKKEQSETV